MNYESLLENFINYELGIKNASPLSIKAYTYDLRKLFRFLKDKELSLENIENHIIEMRKEITSRSATRHIITFKKFFKFCFKKKYLPEDFGVDLEIQNFKNKLPDIISVPTLEDLLKPIDLGTWMGNRDRACIELLYGSALRVCEVVSLTLDNVNLEEKVVRVTGKGGKSREVPITENTVLYIKRYLKYCPFSQTEESVMRKKGLFLSWRGRPLCPRSLNRIFKEYLLQSGIKTKITPHTLRHSLATHFLENGMSLRAIQEILGHASPNSTMLYTQVSRNFKKESFEKYHPRLKMEKRHAF